MTPKTKDWKDRTEGELRALGLEPLGARRAGAARGARWLASEGVPVVYGPRIPAYAGQSPAADPYPWVPPWLNALSASTRTATTFVTALRDALRAPDAAAYAGAVSAAYALGGVDAVEALVLSRLDEEDAA
jgi:hypothetical protein